MSVGVEAGLAEREINLAELTRRDEGPHGGSLRALCRPPILEPIECPEASGPKIWRRSESVCQ